MPYIAFIRAEREVLKRRNASQKETRTPRSFLESDEYPPLASTTTSTSLNLRGVHPRLFDILQQEGLSLT